MYKSIFILLCLFFYGCSSPATNEEEISLKHVSYVFEESDSFKEVHASTLVKINDGQYLVAWFAGTKEGQDDVGIWMAKGDGVNWSHAKEIVKVRNDAHWNPILFIDSQDNIHLYFKVGKEIPTWETWHMVSEDNGDSWTAPKELVKGDRGGRGPVKNKPIILSNGNWLAGASTENDKWVCFADLSTDQGLTWERTENIPFDTVDFVGKGMIQPALWESSPGNVHMLMRSSNGNIYRSDSKNYGKNWSEAYNIGMPNPNSGIDLIILRNNNLILAYNPDNENWGSRGTLLLAESKDNGTNWKDIFTLEKGDQNDEYSYPAMIFSENEVAITYTWNRKHIAFKSLVFKK